MSSTPVQHQAEKVNPGQQKNGPSDFGHGKSTPGTPSNQQYPYNRK